MTILYIINIKKIHIKLRDAERKTRVNGGRAWGSARRVAIARFEALWTVQTNKDNFFPRIFTFIYLLFSHNIL